VKKTRKQYTREEKVAVLRRHLLEQVPVSKLCDELGLQPTVFYRWQREFFENGAAAFQAKARSDLQHASLISARPAILNEADYWARYFSSQAIQRRSTSRE
jgi:transposase